MKDKDLLKALMKDGREVIRVSGSHHVVKKDDQTEVIPIHGRDVTIPQHAGDTIDATLLKKILKQAGLK